MNPTQSPMDETTRRVISMYSQYPYPLVGTHRDMFRDLVYPFIHKLGNVTTLLEAGCGTGNVAIAIAQLLPDTQVVGVDLTEESLHIARESAARLNLRNIEFKRSNLLEFEPALGTYDFVHCQGVIHHLTDPARGLAHLHHYLNPGRYAYIWLYTLLGRRWILDIREMLKLLDVADLPYEEKIEWARRVVVLYERRKLPEGVKRHYFKPNPTPSRNTPTKPMNNRFLRWANKIIHQLDETGWRALWPATVPPVVAEAQPPIPPPIDPALEERRHKAGLADTFLHPHDIFFRLSEIFELFRQAGFTDVQISDGMSTDLHGFLKDECPELQQRLARLPFDKQIQLVELVEKPTGVGFFARKPE